MNYCLLMEGTEKGSPTVTGSVAPQTSALSHSSRPCGAVLGYHSTFDLQPAAQGEMKMHRLVGTFCERIKLQHSPVPSVPNPGHSQHTFDTKREKSPPKGPLHHPLRIGGAGSTPNSKYLTCLLSTPCADTVHTLPRCFPETLDFLGPPFVFPFLARRHKNKTNNQKKTLLFSYIY